MCCVELHSSRMRLAGSGGSYLADGVTVTTGRLAEQWATPSDSKTIAAEHVSLSSPSVHQLTIPLKHLLLRQQAAAAPWTRASPERTMILRVFILLQTSDRVKIQERVTGVGQEERKNGGTDSGAQLGRVQLLSPLRRRSRVSSLQHRPL